VTTAIMNFLADFLSARASTGQRIAATAALAQIVSHCRLPGR